MAQNFSNLHEISRDLTEILELDDELQSEIVHKLLQHGRQSLICHKDNIVGEIYDEQMSEHSRLLQRLKNYHGEKWKTDYGYKYAWFCELINEYEEEENKEIYDRIVTRTAEHGDQYMKDCPLLSIVVQLLFEGLTDDHMSASFNDIWDSLTNDGLNSITNHSDCIIQDIMDRQLRSSEQKLCSPLFMALREYYRMKLIPYLKQSGVVDRNNLYESALDSVAEKGWLDGVKVIEKKTTKNNFDKLIDLINKIPKCTLGSKRNSTTFSKSDPETASASSLGNVTVNEKEKQRLYITELRQDLDHMPDCAEKTAIQLLIYFEEKQLEGCVPPQEDETVTRLLATLQEQITQQELFSEAIQEIFQDIQAHVTQQDVLSTIQSLGKFLKEIRPLNIQEIRRLVKKAKEAGKQIRKKDIILLIGETGTGKSTTIQFLAGCKMQKTLVEVEPGRFLEHITAERFTSNPGLKSVRTSPRSKAETRYITPVTIRLKDIFGSSESGEIILCDAPGFNDTAGPEVDIANSVGITEALKDCDSVKILALSSFQGLGDRGQGIQKLAHLLINMLDKIDERCDAIFYAFTKYPLNVDICAKLIDIKNLRVETDPLLRADHAFVTVLTDMIKKTEREAMNIDPIEGDPKKLITQLKKLEGIRYPNEVFRFSVSSETLACIENQTQRDITNVKCALKHKNIPLVKYYLDNMRILKDLLEHNVVRDAFRSAIRFIGESIEDYCTIVINNFNRLLNSLDGLQKEDTDTYKNAIEYIQNIQVLEEHIGSDVTSPESLIQNIRSELQKRKQALLEEELYSRSAQTYLNNLCILRDSFGEFESFYREVCKDFEERFKKLVQDTHQTISSNDFDSIAEMIRKLYKCLPTLNSHLEGLITEKYTEIIQSLLHHLTSLSDEADSILRKDKLSKSDAETIEDYVKILKSATDNTALQDRISTYFGNLLKENDQGAESLSDLGAIYNGLIDKIVHYFDQINNRITYSLETDNDHTFNDVQELVDAMNTIRVIPDIQSKTSVAYYDTIGKIREHTRKIQTEIESLISCLDQESQTPHYRKICQLLSRLKNAKWMDSITQGAYESVINRVTEDLLDYCHQLEDELNRLDFSWRRPESVLNLQKIFDKIQCLYPLERNISQLREPRAAIINRIFEMVEQNVKLILGKFNLQDSTMYDVKNEESCDYSEGFDTLSAEQALQYTDQCENISDPRIRDIVVHTSDRLKKYVSQFGAVLESKIRDLYIRLTTVDDTLNPLQYAYDLETHFEVFNSLEKFENVFKCIEGPEKKQKLRNGFSKKYSEMNYLMEQYKSNGKHRDLKALVMIAQGLISLDKFCGQSFVSNGFETLYTKYRKELDEGSKSLDLLVQDHISRREYPEINLLLADFDEKRLKSRDGEYIRYSLQQSLSTIMKNVRTRFTEIDRLKSSTEQLGTLKKEITENMEMIRSVSMQTRIMGLISDKSRSDLMNFEQSIKTLFSATLLKNLDRIKELMNNDDAMEAEESMENFNLLQHALADFINIDVTETANNVGKNLNELPKDIMTRNQYTDDTAYSKNPPRVLLPKLKRAAERFKEKYDFCLASIQHDINEHLAMKIQSAYDAPIEKRVVQIQRVNSLLKFLSEELKEQYKSKIDLLSVEFSKDEKVYKSSLQKLLRNEDLAEPDMKQIDNLALELTHENRVELFEVLRNGVIENVERLWNSVQNAVNSNSVRFATNTMKLIIKYKENVQNISEVDGYYQRFCSLMHTNVINCAATLNDMFKFEKTEIIDNVFDSMIIYIEFTQEFPNKTDELLPEIVIDKVKVNLQSLCDYWNTFSLTFKADMNELNVKSLREITSVTERWDAFLKKIRKYSSQHNLIQRFLDIMKNIKLYSEMIDEIKDKIASLKENLDVDLFSEEMAQFETERDEFLHKLGTYLKALKSISAEFGSNLVSETDIQKIEKSLEEKVEDIKKKLLEYGSADRFSTLESDYFRLYHYHLVSINKHFNLPRSNIRDALQKAEAQIIQKVISLCTKINSLESDIGQVADLLIRIKFFAENLSMFENQINKMIEEVVKSYKSKHGPSIFSQLTMILERSDEGARLMAENMHLKTEDWRKRREKMQHQDNLEYFLDNLQGDDVDKDALKVRYKTFREKYDEWLQNISSSLNRETSAEPNVAPIVAAAKILAGTIRRKGIELTWDHSVRNRIPELLAYIFAIWTLKNSQHYNEMRGIHKAQAYLLMPHVGQVISVFRMLGIGFSRNVTRMGISIPFLQRNSNGFLNNLVEMGTGEGKSVVIAVTACVFALLDVNVYCSCYSEYLSVRDKNDFASVFQALGIEKYIQYGTFNTLCENFLNDRCNVRERLLDMIMNNKNSTDVSETKNVVHQKVLLIDEVDVFLNEKYYGGTYTFGLLVQDSLIKTLFDEVWKNRHLRSLHAVKSSSVYQACASRFSNWIFLFDEAISDMLVALQSFRSSSYIVQNDRIVYVQEDSVAENIVRGYDTIWVYYYENQRGFISQKSLQTHVGMIVNSGTISYAEMPHEFDYIVGVTGTLHTLAQKENAILNDIYHISKNTYLPSVFGKSNRTYNPANDVYVVEKSEYFMRIRGETDILCNAQRVILVFFATEEKLMAFYNSSELSDIRQNVQVITEKLSGKERELCIRRAVCEGKVTLLTRIFGRGIDFICRNQQLLSRGGIHVLQTFFSEELSEEHQIIGRGARQGDPGSYRMLLLDSDLEWVLGADWKRRLPTITGSTLYTSLNEVRCALYDSKCTAKDLAIEQCKHEHTASIQFRKDLSLGNMDAIKNFLLEENRGPKLVTGFSRTMVLMDGTGSMSTLLSAAKDTVCTMFERATTVLQEQNISNDEFQLQFVVYRDYDCRDGILEKSSWETKPNKLRSFMAKIKAMGGGDYEEAIEIGLFHAVKESTQEDSISQVILIGDAPSKSIEAINRDRETSGGTAYWAKTDYKEATHFMKELDKLKEKNIPVHTFYLHDGAKENFQLIADKTGGVCKYLKIQSKEGAETLIHLVTQEILRKTAGSRGEAAVELYQRKYVRTSFLS